MSGYLLYFICFVLTGCEESPTSPENHPPFTPSHPFPADSGTNIPINVTLTWRGGDSDVNDIVYYDIYFDTVSPPSLVYTN